MANVQIENEYNPNWKFFICCECSAKTELAVRGVKYCKHCGAPMCREFCTLANYHGPRLNRTNYECCQCGGLTEGAEDDNPMVEEGEEYCRFCGASLCIYCGTFVVRFMNGAFMTEYDPPGVRPLDYQEPGRSPRRRPLNHNRQRTTQRPRRTEESAQARGSNMDRGETAQGEEVASGRENMETTSDQKLFPGPFPNNEWRGGIHASKSRVV